MRAFRSLPSGICLVLGCLAISPWIWAPPSAAAEASEAQDAAAPRRLSRFFQDVAVHRERQQGLPTGEVQQVRSDARGVFAQTTAGWRRWADGAWQPSAAPDSDAVVPPNAPVVHQIACGADRHAAATSLGLYERSGSGDWERLRVEDAVGRVWADGDVRGVAYDAQGRLWFAARAGVACRSQDGWTCYTGADGLPYNDFTCCAAGPEGSVWFGTNRGAIRFHEGQFAYRQGPRWLPHDEVRSIAVDDQGAAWFATPGGVGCIERRRMTLAEKAAWYEQEIDRLIKRTPYGYVAEAILPAPGDKRSSAPQDSDNDGLWTSMYGASQCLAYAATGSEHSRQRARQAFEALRFLQTVTQGGAHAPPPGYVARTILPASGPDPNVGRLESDRRIQAGGDRMWKVYEPRWPTSADGQWYWKSDTSSDELDGHYFFYALYYDLVAQSDAERTEVRDVVCALTDCLVEHDFALVDHDGQPTRWAVFGPAAINGDFRWSVERGLNSLSMLSYLAVAQHVSGEPRYAEAIEHLVNDHAYDKNALVPKVQQGVGSGNQSDDEMAVMSLYNLVKYEQDPQRRTHYLAAFFRYWQLERPERNPFFHFAYAALGRGEKLRDAFAEHDLSPYGDWLDDCVGALQQFPLDRLNWPHQNSHRIDLRPLGPEQSRDLLTRDADLRAVRFDGKALPVDERFFAHWNTDPFELDYGGDGRMLASGTVFLLPYYLGLHHELIVESP